MRKSKTKKNNVEFEVERLRLSKEYQNAINTLKKGPGVEGANKLESLIEGELLLAKQDYGPAKVTIEGIISTDPDNLVLFVDFTYLLPGSISIVDTIAF